MSDKATAESTDPNAEGTADPTKTGEPEKKIAFDPDQTEWVNTLANKMFGKGFDKAKSDLSREWEGKLGDAQKQIEDLTSKVTSLSKKAEAKPQPDKAHPDEMQALTGQIEALRQQMAALTAERDAAKGELGSYKKSSVESKVKSEFLEAARSIPFFDPMEVYQLMRHEVEVGEDGHIVIKNAKTNVPRYNSNAEPLTLLEALQEFAKSKPYMVRMANADGGTGSGEGRKVEVKTASLKDVGAMTAEQFEAYKQKLKSGR